jgi:hypothetical protein
MRPIVTMLSSSVHVNVQPRGERRNGTDLIFLSIHQRTLNLYLVAMLSRFSYGSSISQRFGSCSVGFCEVMRWYIKNPF